MMERKTELHFFTVADFVEEEQYLRKMHNNGWKLVKMVPPCFFTFEKCEAEDVVYKLDYKNNTENEEYMQIFNDYGWEYVTRCVGWLYFRKSMKDVANMNDEEIFSDNASKIEMLEHILRTRMTPLFVIFLCCIVPNVSLAAEGFEFLGILFAIMFVIYVYLLIHCNLKVKKMKKELE